MTFPPILNGQIWKIATGGAAVLALILSALLLSAYFETRHLSSERDKLTLQINDPKTGYIAQLAQSRTNVAQLETTVDVQSKKYEQLSNESKARIADTQKKLDVAQAKTKTMQGQLKHFMSTAPQGATLEQRIQDIDARAMKEFVQ